MTNQIIYDLECCISDAKTEIVTFISGEDLTNCKLIDCLMQAWTYLSECETHISNLKEDLK